jgi:hypothetical protein
MMPPILLTLIYLLQPQVAAMDGGARWHPSSPRVSPRIPSALPGTLVSVEALVIDCVMGFTTSEDGGW